MNQLTGEPDSITRRGFIGAASCLAALSQTGPKRIAVVAAVYTYLSQAQEIADRFLIGYPADGAWHRPSMKIVSLYTEQRPKEDLGAARAREFGFGIYKSLAEALRCGGKRLAVDAVLLVGEPAFLEECVQVFEQDGRSVPVFHDMQLSSSFEKARRLVESSKRLRFPILAGSALPLAWRLPDVEIPAGAIVEEAVMIAGSSGETANFHALEAMQSMLEQRKGGESGVRAVRMLEGAAVWKADWSNELLGSALSRSDSPQGLTLRDGRTQDLLSSGELQVLARKPALYQIEYRDGLKASLFMLDGAIADFNFAARVRGHGLISTQFLIPPPPNRAHLARLAGNIEQMFATSVAPHPIERTLLVGGILESCRASRQRGGVLVETPDLQIGYHIGETGLSAALPRP
jgi:hypothetical protein